ncbi:MAG: hypothetical protein ABI831_12865 [Betaproteobacteria bacterium]
MNEEVVKFSNQVALQRGHDGEVLLHYHGVAYKATDVVPMSIYPTPPARNKTDARAFVRTAMLREHGPSRKSWPALVKEVLGIKAPVPGHKPSPP